MKMAWGEIADLSSTCTVAAVTARRVPKVSVIPGEIVFVPMRGARPGRPAEIPRKA